MVVIGKLIGKAFGKKREVINIAVALEEIDLAKIEAFIESKVSDEYQSKDVILDLKLLHTCAKFGFTEVGKFLLEKYQISPFMSYPGDQSPYDVAMAYNQIKVLQLFESYGFESVGLPQKYTIECSTRSFLHTDQTLCFAFSSGSEEEVSDSQEAELKEDYVLDYTPRDSRRSLS